ncbi:solute carrier family 36 (proton-coupled amino acid transporter) [Cryptococcus wingfieldii CBS 7118]|uniref:Solute carrier family 36 (Proton-coupled amino acid transporter) n=1 Tax=Cryptococcus wingfieldii CBS 7118 TaxID=1295528 RepID=A0A1E3J4V6_9TREE|nr:solute carrier family 36 (proton-coupled amino acid transporter) [Cryptococcus wingfieldii CBS 7118]ODN95920.1 solute carrier family 36 (proton-coupled amino acid transporter) [Cryptococcus wingfieldii CBS 7118]
MPPPESLPRSDSTTPAPSTTNTPPIPNIPPRQSSNTAQGVPRSLGASFRGPSPLSAPRVEADRSASTGKEGKEEKGKGKTASPGASNENLIGAKTEPRAQHAASALTAALGASQPSSPAVPASETLAPTPGLSRQGSSNFARPSFSRAGSGASTPKLGVSYSKTPQSGPGDSSLSNLVDVTDEEKARVLRRHLVSAEERQVNPSPSPNGSVAATPSKVDFDEPVMPGESGVTGYGSTDNTRDDADQFPIPYDAPGGDVTHDLYKWQHDHRSRPGRSASFSHVPVDRSDLDPSLAHIKEPGGFRRNFVVNRAQEQGLEAPDMVRNVIDFLFLYGHFAGEDLNEDEDVLEEEDEEAFPAGPGSSTYARRPFPADDLEDNTARGQQVGERRPLLGSTKRTMSRRRRAKSGPGQGTASVTQAVLMASFFTSLLKGFVGTGILFMGKAFFNGGILFSAIVMVAIAMISLWSFLLLVEAYMAVPGSFGDIGGALYGNNMRYIILFSITVSQIGFVAAYTIFIAENLQAFIMAVTKCATYIPIKYLIFAQLIIFMPLSMIRNLAKLSGTALVADAFILIGILYIGGNEISVLSKSGVADVQLFNPDSFPLLIGTAVFAFEGIGLVIPITESMKEPKKFPKLLSGIMVLVAVLFAGAGVMSYAAYGSEIQTVVIVNLPQDDKFVQAVQFLYSVAILLSSPLQLFPAVRIMENGLFSKSGKHNPSVKWQKNVFRACTVVFCSLLSWAGSSELDKFVSLIGSFACIPLCFIYPPMLHLRACADTRRARILDWTLIVFGVVVGAFTTVQTLRSLFIPTPAGPKFGNCE